MAKIKNLFKVGVNKILPGRQPDFLIIGAQKSATTSLHFYLRQHPLIIPGKAKEIDFFSKDVNFEKGVDWYSSHFKGWSAKRKLFFEASPSYLYRSFAPQRIYEYDSKLRLIVIIRNPVERSFSAWNMYRDIFEADRIPERFNYGYDGKENYLFKYLYKDRTSFPSFEECIEIEMDLISHEPHIEEPSILRRSIYYDQISRYYQLFPKEQMLIVGFEELLKDKKQVLNEICKFLGLEETHWDFLIDKPKHEIKYKTSIDPATKLKLEEYFRPFNNKLYQLTNKNFGW